MCLCEQAHPCLESAVCQRPPWDGGRPFWMSPASAMDAVSLWSEPGDRVGLSWGWGCPVQAGEFCRTRGSSCPLEPRPLLTSPLRPQGGGFWNQTDPQLPLPKSPSWTKRHQLVLGSKKECKQLSHRSCLSLPCESRTFCSLDLKSATCRFPGNAWECELASGGRELFVAGQGQC